MNESLFFLFYFFVPGCWMLYHIFVEEMVFQRSAFRRSTFELSKSPCMSMLSLAPFLSFFLSLSWMSILLAIYHSPCPFPLLTSLSLNISLSLSSSSLAYT